MLEPNQLNDADRAILEFMSQDGDRVTPSFLEQHIDWSRSYISQRLKRLGEHGHLSQPATGLWVLEHDPRDN